MSLGLEFDEELAFRMRDEVIPNAALFLTSGRGIAATPVAGPTSGVSPRDSTWCHDRSRGQGRGPGAARQRGGSRQDLGRRPRGAGPEAAARVYRAIIDEAHENEMRVVAHLGTTMPSRTRKTFCGPESTDRPHGS